MRTQNLTPTPLHGVLNASLHSSTSPRSLTRGYEHHVDNLRGVSILLVVLTHMSTLHLVDTSHNAIGFLVAGATTWFVFLSGYLFYRTEHGRFNYATYLHKKFKSVWSPYLVFMALCVVLGILRSRPAIHDMSTADYALWSVFVGGELVVPLWFIPMISLFFLASPIIMKLADQRGAVALTAVLLYVSLCSGRPAFNLNPVLSAIHFAGFYMLGVVCGKHAARLQDLCKSAQGWIWMSGGLLVFFFGFSLHDPSLWPATFQGAWGRANPVELGKLGLLVTSFVGFSRWLGHPVPALAYLAKISFGIFFVHGFAEVAYSYFERFARMDDARWTPAIEFIFVLGLSILVVEVIRRTAKSGSRYVVGC